MNRIHIVQTLLQAGVDGKDVAALCRDHMKDKAMFFAKLLKAQQALGKIIKDTRDQRGRNYAGVDQFVGKAQRAFNEAGLTMFESQTCITTKGEKDRSWMLDAIIGDTTTGFSLPLQYEVPINPMAWNKEPEKAVGASDSYGLKYLTRGVLFAERSEHDPDRRDDPDHAGYDDAPKKSRPPSPAPAKKKTPKKVSASERKSAAQKRMAAAKSKLGHQQFNALLENVPMNNVAEMEAAADVFDSRIRLDELAVKAVKRFGEQQVQGWLELFRPFTNKSNIDDGLATLVEELNSKEGEKE